MLIDDGDPIDGNSINKLSEKVDNIKDKLIKLVWRNALGDGDKTLSSADGKNLQIIAGTVPVEDKTAKDDEVAIQVNFYKSFGGNKAPTVVAMPVSASPYGVSVKKVRKDGFVLVIHQFPERSTDDRLHMTAINYIAIGAP